MPVASAAARASAVARLRAPFCRPPVLRPSAIASNYLIYITSQCILFSRDTPSSKCVCETDQASVFLQFAARRAMWQRPAPDLEREADLKHFDRVELEFRL